MPKAKTPSVRSPRPVLAASLALANLCHEVLSEKKGEDLQILDVSEKSSITNYLVLATATSEPHLRALRVEVQRALATAQTRLVGVETAQESGWTVIDAFDVMVHIFSRDQRENYSLEQLWRDAEEVPLAKAKAAAKRRAKAKTSAKAKAPAKAKAKAKKTKPKKSQA